MTREEEAKAVVEALREPHWMPVKSWVYIAKNMHKVTLGCGHIVTTNYIDARGGWNHGQTDKGWSIDCRQCRP